jgi:hypothetical protein
MTGINARDHEEWKQIERFFKRVLETIKRIVEIIVQRNEKYLLASKAFQSNLQIVLYTLRSIFKVFKKSIQSNDTVYLSMLPELKAFIRQYLDNILSKCLDEGQEEINSFLEHRQAFDICATTEQFLMFFNSLEYKFPLTDKLRKAEEEIEADQIETMRATLQRRYFIFVKIESLFVIFCYCLRFVTNTNDNTERNS